MAQKEGKKRKLPVRILRGVLKTLIILPVVIVLLPMLLYVPFIQDFAVDLACRKAGEATGMEMHVGKLRLKWPLQLSLDDIVAIEQSGDTLASLGNAQIDVRLIPLLHGEAIIDKADICRAFYRMGTPDSIMYLTVNAEHATIESGSTYNFKKSLIDVNTIELDGGRVMLAMKDTIAPTPADTSKAEIPLRVLADKVILRNIDYTMTMLPVIDSLGAHVEYACLEKGLVDLKQHLVLARSLSIDSVRATYLTPSLDYHKEHPAKAAVDSITAASDSALWTVTADTVRLTAKSAIYAVRGVKPSPGLDMNYLSARDIKIEVDSFLNCGQSIGATIRELKATERCGLEASLTGRFDMDPEAMHARGIVIALQRSQLKLDGIMGMGDLLTDRSLPLSLHAKGYINPADAALALPAITPMVKSLPRGTDLNLLVDIDGTSGRLNVNNIDAKLGGIANLTAKGYILTPFNPEKIRGKVKLDGNIKDANSLKPTLLDAQTAKSVNIPAMHLAGAVNYAPGAIDGHLTATTGGGKIAGKGSWKAHGEQYEAMVSAERFPVADIMPLLGVGDVTARITAHGHGYNPLLSTTSMDVDMDLVSAEYLKKEYSDIRLTAHLANGKAEGEFVSNNPDLDDAMDFTLTLGRDGYTWDVNGEVHRADLMALNISKETLSGNVDLHTAGSMSTDMSRVEANAFLTDIDWEIGSQRLIADTISIALSADSTMEASLSSGDLLVHATAQSGLKELMGQMTAIPALIDTIMVRRSLDVNALEHALPQMTMAIRAGRNNLLSNFLSQQKTDFGQATITFTNDSLIHLNANVLGLRTSDTRLDTINFALNQKGKYLLMSGALNQRPGTMDQFAHVGVNGFISDKQLSMLVRQRDIQGKQGYFLGMNVTATDSTLDLRLVPRKPVIAYKTWTLNSNNLISLDLKNKRLSADLQLSNAEDSNLRLYTLNESQTGAQEDIVLQLNKIKIQDWISINPFAPPVKGDVDANMRFHMMQNGITGKGTAAVNNLIYGKERVGDFGLDIDVSQARGGVLNADLGLYVDSVKVITAQGALNDTTRSNPFMLDFSMIRFPLAVANPFLPKQYARLKGTLSGKMDITGTMTEPIFNGYLQFDTASCKVGMLGSTLTFSSTRIPVDGNVVSFNDFSVAAVNKNPLRVNGTVDARSFINPIIDLSLAANNMQIVGSSRPQGANVYGKAFVDLNAKVKGDMKFMRINADLNVLPSTNVTYILGAETSEIVNQKTDMVRFVVFADSVSAEQADTIQPTGLNMLLGANLTISEGSTINVDLSTDGSNKLSLQSAGVLTYSQNPMNDGRLTGRLNINSGFIRYTPPLMSEKLFNFQSGSYISFTGNMLNPILNVHAIDHVKANVTQRGQDSRLVNFDVSLAVTNTLQDMNVVFDLSTNDDMTVENELSSMSPQQRANQAMNLLLYNVYSGNETKGDASLSGNPLYSFLEGRINAWAANNIKGVDLSFGIDQYDKTSNGSTSSAMSYSYKVSKTLFNDRFKIVVGGNYSTDANADENFQQNLINDISFDYMLNKSGTMYVHIFRHVGYESILEGEITQTGVGFVMRRKLKTLRDFFKFLPRHRKNPDTKTTNEKN